VFGLFAQADYTRIARDTMLGLLAPVSTETPPYGQLPKAVLDDAYVIGFLQMASLAAMERAKGKPMHVHKARQHFFRAMAEISPDCARRLPRRIGRWKNKADAQHQDYLLGKMEGQSYATAFQSDNEITLQAIAGNFHFMVRHRHLGGGASAAPQETAYH